MNRASEFRMGLVTDGAGHPLEDPAVAFADFDDCEYTLNLEGDASFDILTDILRGASAAADMLAPLQAFVDHYPVGLNPFLDAACNAARAAIAKATEA